MLALMETFTGLGMTGGPLVGAALYSIFSNPSY